MLDREAAAKRLAELMGLIVQEDEGGLFLYNPKGEDIGYVPAATDALSSHLGFVGRIAEACDLPDYAITNVGAGDGLVVVALGNRENGGAKSAPDLSHACLLAAIAALGARGKR